MAELNAGGCAAQALDWSADLKQKTHAGLCVNT